MTPNPDDERFSKEYMDELRITRAELEKVMANPEDNPRYEVRQDYYHFNGTFSGYVSKMRARANAVGAKVPGKFKRRK